MERKTTFAILAIIAAVGIVATVATVATSNMAYAKITSETHNKADQGNPQGSGNGLTTENVNPQDKAPPGHNK